MNYLVGYLQYMFAHTLQAHFQNVEFVRFCEAVQIYTCMERSQARVYTVTDMAVMKFL